MYFQSLCQELRQPQCFGGMFTVIQIYIGCRSIILIDVHLRKYLLLHETGVVMNYFIVYFLKKCLVILILN